MRTLFRDAITVAISVMLGMIVYSLLTSQAIDWSRTAFVGGFVGIALALFNLRKQGKRDIS